MSDETWDIQIRLTPGGPPEVTFTPGERTTRDILDASDWLRDLMIGVASSTTEEREAYARDMWERRQAARFSAELEAAEERNRREAYEQARTIECPHCHRRYKHQSSLNRHIAAAHPPQVVHWRDRGGKTLCGRPEHEGPARWPGTEPNEAKWAVCSGCEIEHHQRVDTELDALAEQLDGGDQ